MENADELGPEVGEGGGMLRDEYERGGGGGGSMAAATESAYVIYDEQA